MDLRRRSDWPIGDCLCEDLLAIRGHVVSRTMLKRNSALTVKQQMLAQRNLVGKPVSAPALNFLMVCLCVRIQLFWTIEFLLAQHAMVRLQENRARIVLPKGLWMLRHDIFKRTMNSQSQTCSQRALDKMRPLCGGTTLLFYPLRIH